jgi:hypothetical protein
MQKYCGKIATQAQARRFFSAALIFGPFGV